MLKYEGEFEVGQTIRSYDFEPSTGRPEYYVEGNIIEITDNAFGTHTKAYMIMCEVDTMYQDADNSRIGSEVAVPMEVIFHEFDNRIKLIK